MKKTKAISNTAKLRQTAEDLIKSISPVKGAFNSWMSETDALKLVHELQVHQIELELQNEELMLAKEQSEIAINEYTELFDFAPSGYFVLSETGKIIELNLSGSQMLGKGRQYLKNTPFGFFVSDDTKRTFSHFLENVFTGKKKETCDVTISVLNKPLLFAHLTGTILANKDLCLVNVMDLTTQRAVISIVEKSILQKNLILEVAGEGIIGIDSDGITTFVNRKAALLLGFEANELIGKDFHDLIHHHYPDGSILHKEDCPVFISLQNEKPATSEDIFWRKDGSCFPVEFTSLAIIENNNVTGAVVTFRDIVARKQAEEKARIAIEKYDAIIAKLSSNEGK